MICPDCGLDMLLRCTGAGQENGLCGYKWICYNPEHPVRQSPAPHGRPPIHEGDGKRRWAMLNRVAAHGVTAEELAADDDRRERRELVRKLAQATGMTEGELTRILR